MVEMFIKKATLIILNSRIKPGVDNDFSLSAVSSSFRLDQKDNNELDDIFLEDFSEILNLNSYIIEIYVKKKKFKTLIEKWSFQYLYSQ